MKILCIAFFAIASACNGSEPMRRPDEKMARNFEAKKTESGLSMQKTEKSADNRIDTGTEQPPGNESDRDLSNSSPNDPTSRLRTATIADVRPISSRTLSLKLTFEGGGAAAFKPIIEGRPRARCEVAVFRLAELLGVGTVPPSTMRELPLDLLVGLLKKRFPSQAGAFAKKALINESKEVAGAMIQWIDDLDPKGLQAIGGSSVFASWLDPSRQQTSANPLAAEAASMIAFDYLTGNWDRFSGGNIFLNGDRTRFVLIDNNEAFAPWTKQRKIRMEDLLTRTGRFSRRLIEAIKKLDTSSIERSLSAEPWHSKQPILTSEEVALILSRRDKLIRHVDRLIAKYGQERVLAFP